MVLSGYSLARLFCLGAACIWLSSCAQPISSNPNSSASSLSGGPIELDPTITAEQYQNSLRIVKGLLLESPFLTRSEQSIADLASYRSAVQSYLDDSRAPKAIQKLYRQVLQLEGTEALTTFGNNLPQLVVDNDEPSSLAAYLYQTDDDFRKLLTADICVSNYESGLTLKANCTSQGRFNRNSMNTNDPNQFFSMITPMQQRAGAISTQGFLKRYAGARDFRRPGKIHEYFLCSAYPDPEENLGWTEQNAQLHPFYWTPSGSEQDCQSCHQALNKSRTFFTGFGSLGEMQMGQTAPRVSDNAMTNVDARVINDTEAATINLPNYVTLYGRPRTDPFESIASAYHGQATTLQNFNPARMNNPSYLTLAQYGQILSTSQRFSNCTAQRIYNLAMGISQSYLNRLPTRLSETLPKALEDSGYSLKSLMLEVFSTSEFLNR